MAALAAPAAATRPSFRPPPSCCPRCGVDLSEQVQQAAPEEEEPTAGSIRFEIGTPSPAPRAQQQQEEMLQQQQQQQQRGVNPRQDSLGSQASSSQASLGSPAGIKFEMGVNSRESTPTIRFDEAPPAFNFKRRHLSDTHEGATAAPGAPGASRSTAGAGARQHWVAVAPRGSLEIRSPAKDLVLQQQRQGGGLGKGLVQNRSSDSKLTVLGPGERGGHRPFEQKHSGGSRSRRSKRRMAAAAAAAAAAQEAHQALHGQAPQAQAQQGVDASGSLPRTLSTSVLRIKHRRSFWEKVIG